MKHVNIITLDQFSCDYYQSFLSDFFPADIHFRGFSIKDGMVDYPDADLTLVTSQLMNRYLKDQKQKGEVFRVVHTIRRDAWLRLYGIPTGTKVLIISSTGYYSLDLIYFLRQLGLDHLEYIPGGPESDAISKADVIVTPGQRFYIPPTDLEIIDIGWRPYSVGSLLQVIQMLGCDTELMLNRILAHSKDVVILPESIIHMFSLDSHQRKISRSLLEMTQGANFLLGEGLHLRELNQEAKRLLVKSESFFEQVQEHVQTDMEKLPREKFDIQGLHKREARWSIEGKNFEATIYGDPTIDRGEILVSLKERVSEKDNASHQSHGHFARYHFEDILGKSPALNKSIEQARRIAGVDKNVLITGETGAGKELFAQSIHNASSRSDQSFIAINISSLPAELIESELFGYESGAFTGARKEGKIGLIESADQGTLFLDEIGETPPQVQTKLLRTLQEGEIMRIGSTQVIPVNVRFIAATNRDLYALSEEGKFRKDLFYRLNALPLEVPALRKRQMDIPILVDDVLRKNQLENKMLSEGDRKSVV